MKVNLFWTTSRVQNSFPGTDTKLKKTTQGTPSSWSEADTTSSSTMGWDLFCSYEQNAMSTHMGRWAEYVGKTSQRSCLELGSQDIVDITHSESVGWIFQAEGITWWEKHKGKAQREVSPSHVWKVTGHEMKRGCREAWKSGSGLERRRGKTWCSKVWRYAWNYP